MSGEGLHNGHNGTDKLPVAETQQDWNAFDFGDASEPIAIIGLATRFPQDASTTENFWDFLIKGRSAWSDFPEDRINSKGHYHPNPDHGGTFAVKGGHFLAKDPAYFDAPFFSTTKTEVLTMDVQQRVLLENVYHALENAGISLPEASNSNTSVFVSGFNHEHLLLLSSDPELTTKYKPTGTSNSLLAGRVSWFYNFVGPSVTIDTACSSSMVAMHLACQSLLNGESNMGIVSGVTIFYTPGEVVGMSHHGFLGKDGRSYSFDHRAEGYGRGEGVGTVIVKRLRDALRDGDTIRAVVRGTGVNQDGRTAGVSLPSAQAQEALMKTVYANAGLDPKDTRIVESHGTGTGAGDPLEASALAKVFSPGRSEEDPLYVCALKSAIGHTEGAAGVAGLIKGVLVLENGILSPNKNFEKPNPRIPVKKWNIKFPLETMPWPTEGIRRISLNSFGVGGTNSHAILDDAYHYLKDRGIVAPHNTVSEKPSPEKVSELVHTLEALEAAQNTSQDHDSNPTNGEESVEKVLPGTNRSNGANGTNGTKTGSEIPKIFPLSSFDEGGVERNAKALATHLSELQSRGTLHASQSTQYLNRLAYTLSSKRGTFPWRSFAIGSDPKSLIESLEGELNPIRVRGATKIGFIFTGQGSQWFAMGRELLAYLSFKQNLEEATAYFQSLGAEWSLIEELSRDKAASRVNEPWLSHPACVSLQMAVTDLLRSWGIVPSRVVGHSSGEIAAAYAANRLGREAAWKTAYFRGYVSAKKLDVKGAMMAVGLSRDKLQPYIDQVNQALDGELVIACLNSPANQTVSGDEAKIDELKEILDSVGDIFARKLNVMNAYHSAHMKLVADEYLASLGDLSSEGVEDTSIEIYSSVTGERVSEQHLGASYWVENMVSPVRFHEAVTAMCFSRVKTGRAALKLNTNAENIFVDTLFEVGPHGAMRSSVKETLASRVSASHYKYLPVLDRSNPGLTTILKAVGFAASQGLKVDLEAVNRQEAGPRPEMLVDLPPYSFNHTDRNMFESRLSKNYRLRKHNRLDLLGAPVPDWNDEFPRWRNMLRTTEQPWLKDHVITDLVILPGVGYLTAVVEASLQLADPSQKVAGLRLKEVSLKRALIIPEGKEGVEVILSFTRMDEASLQGSAIWKRFNMSSYDAINEDWVEHCTGYVATDYETANNPIDEGLEAREEKAHLAKHLAAARETCSVPLDMSRTYEDWVNAGIGLGSLFRNLSDVRCTPDMSREAYGIVTVPDVQETMPSKFLHPHLIQPATMDAFMHLFIVSVVDGNKRKTLDRAIVPTLLKEVWISAKVGKAPGEKYVGHGKSTLLAYDKFESEVTIWDESSEEPLFTVRGIRSSPLDSAETFKKERKLCHSVITPLDPDLLTKEALDVTDLEPHDKAVAYKAWIEKWQLATVLRVTDALQEIQDPRFDTNVIEGHFVNYYEWMKQVKTWLDNDEVRLLKLSKWQEYNADQALKEALYDEVDNDGPMGKLAMRMGSNIVKVLKKEVDPLHLMFGVDDLLDRVYSDLVALGDLPTYNRAFLNAVKESSTNLHILEVGAGVGSSTVPVLEALAPLGGENKDALSLDDLRISKYTFTDVSARFFDKAKDKFKAHESIMEFKTFNIETGGDKQGLALGSYDYVFAGNVVHATQDLRKTLSNLQKMLKPGGKLVLQEGVRHDDFGWSIAFGQLPGWWLAVEPERKWSPWIPIPLWDTMLKDAGFGGVELNLADRHDPDLHSQSVIVARAEKVESSPQWEKVFIINSSREEGGFASKLRDYLTQNLKLSDCTVLHYLDISSTDVSQSVCLSVIELENEILSSPSEEDFINIRQLLITSGALLWITGDTVAHPHLNMITGLIRTVRWERDIEEANLAILSIQEPALQEDQLLSSLARLFKQQFVQHLPQEKANSEFTLTSTGSFRTNRLVDADVANEYLTSRLRSPLPVQQRLGEAGRPLKLATSSPGQLDKLEWVTDELYDKPLGSTEVEIDIKAVGLNFRDLLVAMGEYMATSMGFEATGIVTRVGPGVTRIQPGDRVAFMCSIAEAGCFQTYGRTEERTTVKIPDSVSFQAAAGLLCVYCTVMYGLENAAGLQKEETILIHAAAGGVGQAAIHYAKYVGAEIYATVSTPEKRELLINEYGIPNERIFSSRDATFVKGIKRATNNRGVDVVLNSLAGELYRRSWDLVAPLGRFVEIGKKDAQLNGRISLGPFLRNVTMTSVELPTVMRHKPNVALNLMERTMQLFSEGHIGEAKPTKVMSFSEISDGFRVLQSGKGIGKMVFVPRSDDLLPIVPLQPPPCELSADATYILAGGLGGIGRSLARWMADKGAKHLVFLSRSGQIKGDAEDMVAELKQKGCESHVMKCDTSDAARMKEVLNECQKTLPPIKGCIQGSMVLDDRMFENMSHGTYMTAVRPKVHGSWNLHNLLPRDMDFFVLLSSAAGTIGNRSQANYNAGNVFQDALARHRITNNLPCSVLDLGTVLGVGYVAEHQNADMMSKISGAVHEAIREEEVQHLVEYLMDPRSKLTPTTGHLVSGVTPAANFRQAGMPVPTYLSNPIFTHLRAENHAGSGTSDRPGSDGMLKIQAQLASATTVEEAAAAVLEAMRTKLSALLATPIDNINPSKSVSSNGIDSLIAMEFRTFLVKTLGADIPLLDITGTASVTALSVKVASTSKITQIQVQESSKP
ncbi:unnamed protein product [Clonostachys rhizophaga]|uniref:Carrier domain-containing protein n=1 Tax=Clonostachys rhizophaga TaxID=160324 RepID=A0A9N9VBW8_9HYPO|nr:unnamed protein product [Clonostachys rhizophaga]